ncbi:MAG TPA: cellobiose phosphorylase, partial [Anaerolineae bacterium]|nr:cellobiose phosphorylase [Anaerolineae bacterium]
PSADSGQALRVLPHVKYVITLDADTVIQRGDARRLIGTLAHPLNRPEFDPRTGEVVAGYTILQPRTEIKPTSANQSLFTRVFASDVGLDLYTRAVSDVYQDLFGEGSYVGKGIYDVDAFERSLRGRVPDNTLLSHDLFEGINGRAGLVTDVVVLEDFPPHYFIHAQRLHRWVRGDWQLLPWVLPRPRRDAILNRVRISLIDRWKIVDNLRRSLLGPLLLALLVAGWVWLPGPAFVWTLLGVLMLGAPLGVSLLSALFSGLRQRALRASLRPLRYDALRWFLALAFLLYETLLVLDAILTTLIRLFITRKNLLQWVTAARTARLFSEVKLEVTRRQMASSLLLALSLGLLIGLLNPAALPSAMPLLVTWLLSPEIAYWIGRPIVHRPAPLSPAQRDRLRILARRTWLFFERFVGPDDNWLPPDHFQEAPRGQVAHRTSPTNIGLLLLSTLAAYDQGYIGPLGLALRVRDTFDSLNRLERYRGHFLNWYDTRSLEPLPPRYVSTVDSGNLAACLLALKQACLDLPHAPVLRWQRWEGLLDTLAMLAEVVQGLERVGLKLNAVPLQSYLARVRQQVLAVQDNPDRWAALLTELYDESQAELDRLLIEFVESGTDALDAESLRSLRACSERVRHHLDVAQRELNVLVPWLLLLSQPPALFSRPETEAAVRSAWQALQDALPALARLDEIAAICTGGQARLA